MTDALLQDTYPRWRVMVAEDGEPVLSISLPRVDASVPIARQLVREALADRDLPNLADTTELVTSELASNAARHARHGTLRLTLRRRADRGVRVSVTDKSRTPPAPRSASAEDITGRGLALVDVLSQQWGTDPLPWGKRVWADLRAPEPSERHQPQWQPDEVRIWRTHHAQALYLLALLVVMGALVFGIVRSDQSQHHTGVTEGTTR
ncbi:ATP-binding protein [Streptomyces sp. NPDC088560]|uniref:ATP-binding protein n=1 Tax=Streptomyces sp. NPDC088560 TaxID=3365868 RepID=UPI00380930A9